MWIKNISLKVLGILMGCLLLSSIASAHPNRIIACYSDQHFPPYVTENGSNIPENPGIFIELLQALAKDVDTKLVLIRRPWKRCLKMLASGEVDMIPGASFLKERTEYAHYPSDMNGDVDQSRRLLRTSYMFFYRDEDKGRLNWDGKTFTGLEKEIGVELGFSAATHLKEDGHKVLEVGNARIGIELLSKGRIDSFLSFANLVQPILKLQDHNISFFPIPYKTKDYHLLIGNHYYSQHPKISEHLWERLPVISDRMAEDLAMKYFQ